MREALERRDLDALMDTFAPDATLRSPITSSFRFVGREQLRPLYEGVFQVISDFRVTQEITGADDCRVLLISGEVGGVEFEEVQLLRLNDQGLVREITLFFRPLPALPALAQGITRTLIAKRSRPRSLLLRFLAAPLVAITRIGDRIAARVIGGITGLSTPSR
jgi:hypothetical protein